MVTDPYVAIAQRLFPGATLRSRSPLRGGVSAGVDALDVALPDGGVRRVVLRGQAAEWKHRPPAATATEFALQRALFAAGVAVPEPLLLDASCSLLPSPYVVMELVDGTTALDPRDLPDALSQMADFLSHLHDMQPASLALPALPSGDDPIVGALQYLPTTEAMGPVREALSRTTTRPVREALLHGDYWPGNVLWKDGRLAAVLDWEDAVGDPWSDVACCRVELLCAYGEDAMERFTERYLAASTRDAFNLPVWEVYVSAAALSSMADWGLAPEVEAARRASTGAFLERAARDLVAQMQP